MNYNLVIFREGFFSFAEKEMYRVCGHVDSLFFSRASVLGEMMSGRVINGFTKLLSEKRENAMFAPEMREASEEEQMARRKVIMQEYEEELLAFKIVGRRWKFFSNLV